MPLAMASHSALCLRFCRLNSVSMSALRAMSSFVCRIVQSGWRARSALEPPALSALLTSCGVTVLPSDAEKAGATGDCVCSAPTSLGSVPGTDALGSLSVCACGARIAWVTLAGLPSRFAEEAGSIGVELTFARSTTAPDAALDTGKAGTGAPAEAPSPSMADEGAGTAPTRCGSEGRDCAAVPRGRPSETGRAAAGNAAGATASLSAAAASGGSGGAVTVTGCLGLGRASAPAAERGRSSNTGRAAGCAAGAPICGVAPMTLLSARDGTGGAAAVAGGREGGPSGAAAGAPAGRAEPCGAGAGTLPSAVSA